MSWPKAHLNLYFYTMKKIITSFLLLSSVIASAQSKLNYGLILGADRFLGVNETNPEGFELTNQTIPKIGFFVEKKLTDKYSYNISFTYHRFFENYKYMNRVVGSDERFPFEVAVGAEKYMDLNLSLRYRVHNNFFAYGGTFFSYHNNGHTEFTSSNPVTGELTFMLKKVAREDINGGLHLGVSYELNPKSKFIVEPFAHANFSVTNREKFRLNSYIENTLTEHKYNRLYFSFGAKFKFNRNK